MLLVYTINPVQTIRFSQWVKVKCIGCWHHHLPPTLQREYLSTPEWAGQADDGIP